MYLLNRTVKSTDFALYTGFMMSGTSAEFLSVKFSKGKDTWAQWKCLELGKKKTKTPLWLSTALSPAFLRHMVANLLASRWIPDDGLLYSSLILPTTEQNGREGWRMNLPGERCPIFHDIAPCVLNTFSRNSNQFAHMYADCFNCLPYC